MKLLLLLVMATGLEAIGDNGWYTWRVTTDDYESRWCCAEFGGSYTSDSIELATSNEMQIRDKLLSAN